MSVQTLKIGSREFVLLPKREYNRLVEKQPKRPVRQAQGTPVRLSEQDKGDVAEAKRRLKSLAQGRSKAIPLKELKAELGL
jgi:hypothetical protein